MNSVALRGSASDDCCCAPAPAVARPASTATTAMMPKPVTHFLRLAIDHPLLSLCRTRSGCWREARMAPSPSRGNPDRPCRVWFLHLTFEATAADNHLSGSVSIGNHTSSGRDSRTERTASRAGSSGISAARALAGLTPRGGAVLPRGVNSPRGTSMSALVLALDHPEQVGRGGRAVAADVARDRGQRRMHDAADQRVVPADQREVVGDRESHLLRDAEAGDGEEVAVEDDRRRRLRAPRAGVAWHGSRISGV